MKRFSIATLGCKVNSFESELIAEKLAQQSYQRVSHTEPADLCVINTCTVTAEADRQARQLVRRVVRNNPRAKVVVTGCYAQMQAQACASIAGVSLVVGNQNKLDIAQWLAQVQSASLPPTSLPNPSLPTTKVRAKQAEESPARRVQLAPAGQPTQDAANPPTPTLLSGFDGRTRAFVQIQQGCDQGCTFCIIHQARGANRSFSGLMIKRQVERLVRNGYRELVLCGVDIGSYGSDFAARTDHAELATAHVANWPNSLTDLLRQLLAVKGDFRIRLSSIDPAHITARLIAMLAAEPKLCPQLHLSLQSANTLILKRMKRRASRELVYRRVAELRAANPDLVLGADLLVGFPTETEAQFQQTLDAVHELEIAYPHVFAYSPRAGTPAAKIPAQVAPAERKRRAKLVRARGKQVWRQVAARQIGAHCRVLIEGHANLPTGVVRARAANYFPVLVDAPPSPSPHPRAQRKNQSCQPGDWAEVEIVALQGDDLIARRLD